MKNHIDFVKFPNILFQILFKKISIEDIILLKLNFKSNFKIYCIKIFISILALFILDTGKEVLLQTKAVFHQGLHCLQLKIKQSLWTELHHFIEFLAGNPLEYKIDYPILVVSIYMG